MTPSVCSPVAPPDWPRRSRMRTVLNKVTFLLMKLFPPSTMYLVRLVTAVLDTLVCAGMLPPITPLSIRAS